MKIKRIVVRVSFEDGESEALASAACVIPVDNIRKVKPRTITDACQRAVAHCTDELQKQLDKTQ